ncbi:transcription factor grauzone-like isoform X2 [Bradysia coprophila]|uniref:transcription factor grauzone-like isoform X2 n=1 Tax=Bradysia coprophila TaxID=38358 RepID=UPI00187DCEF4|nr:transcription factor grauzone-like isoform X2 [Bradysia coprophila]
MNSKSTHVCRLCLESSDDDLLNIFEKFQDSTIALVLAKHFWFQIDKNDGLPEWVCEICWIQTKTFHNFYKRLEFRHKNYLNSIVMVKVDEIKQERSVSPTEEALEADLSLVKCNEETDKLETDGMQTIKESDSCDEDNNENSCDQSDTEQSSDEEDKPKNEDVTTNRTLPVEPHSQSEVEKQDAQIRRFFKMKCEICSDVELDTLKRARKHYRQAHKTIGYLTCCGKKFKFRYRMLDHIRYHVNPDAHRCEQCGKSFKDRQALKIHGKTHVPLNLRDHKCSLCSKICTTAASLKYHVQHKHPTDSSETFPCDQCDRICQSKTLLACHIRNVHDSSLDHVCEICGRTFKHNTSLQNHKDIEHSTTPPPKVQCDICGTWLKHERNLWHHLKIHQEMQEAQDGNSQAASCPTCNKKLQSKRLLATHIRNSHGERKHQCTFCDKAFKTPKNLKEHIALHTGVDLYCCLYCDRTFKSNANMYSHRKKAHLAEWTRDKAEKDRCNLVAPSKTKTADKLMDDS